MDEKRTKIARGLIGEAKKAADDYHGDKYWDLLHERQQLLLKMMVIILDEMIPKETREVTVKEKKVG